MRKNLKSGFTLIEMLIVVALFGVLAVALMGIFLASLRASIKSDRLREVRQSGSQVMDVIGRQLRGARSIVTCSTYIADDGISVFAATEVPDPGGKFVDYVDANGNQAHFICDDTTFAYNRIASISAVVQSGTPYYLTSENVRVTDCAGVFTCRKNAADEPVSVIVDFRLEQVDTQATNPVDRAKADFKTEITLRN